MKIKTSLAIAATLGSLLCFSVGAQAETIVTDTNDVLGGTWDAITSPFGFNGYRTAYDSRGYGYDAPAYRSDVVVYHKRCSGDKETHFIRKTNGKWNVHTYRTCNYL